jgi:hypothetical protein
MRRKAVRRAAIAGGAAAAAKHRANKSKQSAAAPQPQPPEPASAPAPAAEVGSPDMVSQLQNLKKLLDDGVLTQAEFDMEKQKILSSS